ncbi:MAG TPA: tRNA dihydrouridine(20/20a) synthase DusA [Crenotrichaceae bacterium]|nr:tRNA dihydrouridine(20/20a) synthase DusA [Crenotrichaceae bacterium]
MVVEPQVIQHTKLNRTLCLAPMLDRTDRHFRYFLRLISKHTVLFTEMVTTNALLRGDREFLLEFHPSEHPLVFQLGGSDPNVLSKCAIIVEQAGYDEINLNIGCPSDRVQKGRFGACLMKEPELVGDCVAAMQSHVRIPVTIKARLGVDEVDRYDDVAGFINTVSVAGCGVFYMHARKAWLKGLSPKQNRNVPPLNYAMVKQLLADFPGNEFIINGGIKSIDEIQCHLSQVHGVMLGRHLYENPFMLQEAEHLLFPDTALQKTRSDVLNQYFQYVDQQLGTGDVTLHSLVRHLFGLFHGQPGARLWRRGLSDNSSAGQRGFDKIRLLAQTLTSDRALEQDAS